MYATKWPTLPIRQGNERIRASDGCMNGDVFQAESGRSRTANKRSIFPGEVLIMHTCPVCGYQKLPRPAEEFLICPCCGVEFGYDDANVSHTELRLRWLGSGAPWFSRVIAPDLTWTPIKQLAAAGFVSETRITTGSNTASIPTRTTQSPGHAPTDVHQSWLQVA
jgi:ribosomal protein L37AE/L43A